MTDAQRAALVAAASLLRAGFADYADAVLQGSAGEAGAPALRLIRDGHRPRALAWLDEAARGEGGK